MNVSGERRGSRVWWIAAALVAMLIVWHAQSMSHYLDRVTAERFSTREPILARESIQSGSAFDGMTWLRLSADMASGDTWRFRDTHIDNSPEGRDVFWSSGWAWWLIGAGKIWAKTADVSFERGLEHAARWVHVPVLLGFLLSMGTWVARRWGEWAAAVLAAGVVGHRAFYEGFLPGNPDHHGVIAGCVLGMVLGVLMAGAGWVHVLRDGAQGARGATMLLPPDQEAARRCMMVSAGCGGVGMWFSAASMVPAIAVLGLMSVVAAVVLKSRMEEAGGRAIPAAWRVWGRVGAGTAFAFYLLENFPDRLGWRMEINHPCYCLAWWGAGECIAVIMERGTESSQSWVRRAIRWGLGAAAVASPAMIVWFGGASVFVPMDSFVVEVYRYVSELDSMGERIAKMGTPYYADYAVLHPLLLVIAGGLWWAARISAARLLLFVSAGVGLLLMGLGWWQTRWLLIASGPLIALAALMVATLPLTVKTMWRRHAVSVLIVSVFFLIPWRMVTERERVEERTDIQALEAMQLLYRDIARVLKGDAGERSIALLSSPDASVSISYYADGSSIGTLYWENIEGMKRTGAIYAAAEDAVALAGIKDTGVTHVVIVSPDNGISEYAEGMRSLGLPATVEDAFASRLLEGRVAPLWLRPIAYSIPVQFARLAPTVRLYAFDEKQSPAEAHYRHGVAFAFHKDYDRAMKHFWEASALAPDMPAPWFRLSEVLLAKREFSEACDLMIVGVRLVAQADRPQAFREASQLFASRGAEAEAERLRALASAAAQGQ